MTLWARRAPLATALAVALAIVPAAVPDFHVTLLSYIGIATITVLGLVLLTGISGQTSFGQASFMGLAAYATTVCTKLMALPPLAGLAAGLLLTGATAWLLGLITARLSGHYLALVSVAWGISFFALFGTLPALHGFNGIGDIPPLTAAGLSAENPRAMLTVIWACALLLMLLSANLLDSRTGRAIRTLNGARLMGESMGIDTARLSRAVFVLAALYAALAGFLFAHFQRFISPTPFSLGASIDYLFMAIIGGAGSLLSAPVGAAIVVVLRDQFNDWVPRLTGQAGNYEALVFGVFVIVLLQRAPAGILPLLTGLLPRPRSSTGPIRPAVTPDTPPPETTTPGATPPGAPSGAPSPGASSPGASSPGEMSPGATPSVASPPGIAGCRRNPGIPRPGLVWRRARNQYDTQVPKEPGYISSLAAAPGHVLLSAEGVSRYFGGLAAARDVSFDLRAGEVVALIGPNGAGKTTLFNVISGLLPPSTGRVTLFGRDTTGLSARHITGLGLARTFQHVKLLGDRSVLENIALGTHLSGRSGVATSMLRLDRKEEAAIQATARVQAAHTGIGDLLDRPAGDLPFGQQRIVEVARALCRGPRLLLLDEPAAGLRQAEKHHLASLLRRLRAQGLGVLIVEHDMDFVMGLADRVVVMDFGLKIAEGPPDAVRADPAVREAYLGAEA